MKQSRSGETYILHTLFSEKELEVGDILLDLEEIVFESEIRTKFSFKWGARKRRSAINSTPSPPRLRSSPCLQKPDQEEREIDSRIPKVKTEVTSPLTPLLFSPSESEEKSKKISKKKTRKKWLEIIDGLTKRKELLTREVDVVRSYRNKLLTFNLALKAKKDEMKFYQIKKNTQLEIERGLNIGMKVDQQEYPVTVFPHHSFGYPTPYQPQISGIFQIQNGPFAPVLASSSGLGLVNQASGPPHGIPDLNICCAEDTFGVRGSSSSQAQAFGLNARNIDDAKLIAAERRRRRMIQMNKNKLGRSQRSSTTLEKVGNCPS